MTRWARGEAEIERMLKSGELQAVTGTAADGGPWLTKAAATIRTAESISPSDPHSAYTLAYDAARFACVGLLAQQGLRPTTAGGHYAVQVAVVQQFGSTFAPYAVMRRRRNELEYPELPDETVEPEEVAKAISNAKAIIDAARKLIEHLGFSISPLEAERRTPRCVYRRSQASGHSRYRRPQLPEDCARRVSINLHKCSEGAVEFEKVQP